MFSWSKDSSTLISRIEVSGNPHWDASLDPPAPATPGSILIFLSATISPELLSLAL